MTKNEKKLQDLHLEIERRIERRVSKFIVRIALDEGISTKEVVVEYSAHIDMLRNKLKYSSRVGYKKEIDTLERAIKREQEPVEAKAVRKSKLEREYDFIKDKVFNEQLGYKKIASLLGKSEKTVQKIVVKIMCESVA